MTDYSVPQLQEIARTAGVLRYMAEHKKTKVVLDYIPSRLGQAFIREDPNDDSIEIYPTKPIKITFKLEDAMFGGYTFVALTCGEKILLTPFVFENFDSLRKQADAARW